GNSIITFWGSKVIVDSFSTLIIAALSWSGCGKLLSSTRIMTTRLPSLSTTVSPSFQLMNAAGNPILSQFIILDSDQLAGSSKLELDGDEITKLPLVLWAGAIHIECQIRPSCTVTGVGAAR